MTYNNVGTHARDYDTITFIDFPKKQNRKQSKRIKKQKALSQQKGIDLRQIFPITDNQEKAFESFSYNKNILLHGVAGTGKTFISLYLALKNALNSEKQTKCSDRPKCSPY